MLHQNVLNNYTKAVNLGVYDHQQISVHGKHDYVRAYWEDQYTRLLLRSPIKQILKNKSKSAQGIRVIDLGCGTGEGFKILTTIPDKVPLSNYKEFEIENQYLASASNIEYYKGVDLSEAMVAKGKELYSDYAPQVEFFEADLNEGLPVNSGEIPYDIYFSSYGSLSHLTQEKLSGLLQDICKHMGEEAFFIVDVLGRYSYEWPCYWDKVDPQESEMITYSMSYIYPPSCRQLEDIDFFLLRYWGGQELDQCISEAVQKAGRTIKRRRLCDRSILVGRHMDTNEYNPHASALRAAINSLYNNGCNTDLNNLMFFYNPHPNYPHLNEFYNKLQVIWNNEVIQTQTFLNKFCYGNKNNRMKEETLNEIIIKLIKLQLASQLRKIEWKFQQGLGMAHGLVAIYQLC